jgi:hypothetical protein
MITNIIRIVLIGIMLTVLSGVLACSSLSVQVDVLRPEIVSSRANADAITRAMPLIVVEDDMSVERVFLELMQAHYDAYQDIADRYRADAEALPRDSQERVDLNIAASSLETLSDEMKDFYRRKEQNVKAINAMLRQLWVDYGAVNDDAAREKIGQRMFTGIIERQALLQSVYAMIGHDLDDQLEGFPDIGKSTAKAVIKRTEAIVRQGMKNLFDGGGLLHSGYTYYVVGAEESDWALMFDRTFANSLFGNTDIAIKALGPGNFTIKGLSFNPADVAAAASKVATQTILLAAQIAGVPVKVSGTPEPNTDGAALAKSSSTFSKTLEDAALVDEKITAHRDALMRIASVIVQEREIVNNGTPAERKASLEVIHKVYLSHADRLPVTSN